VVLVLLCKFSLYWAPHQRHEWSGPGHATNHTAQRRNWWRHQFYRFPDIRWCSIVQMQLASRFLKPLFQPLSPFVSVYLIVSHPYCLIRWRYLRNAMFSQSPRHKMVYLWLNIWWTSVKGRCHSNEFCDTRRRNVSIPRLCGGILQRMVTYTSNGNIMNFRPLRSCCSFAWLGACSHGQNTHDVSTRLPRLIFAKLSRQEI